MLFKRPQTKTINEINESSIVLTHRILQFHACIYIFQPLVAILSILRVYIDRPKIYEFEYEYYDM